MTNTDTSIGHNSLIPTPEQITFDLRAKYEELFNSTSTLLEKARSLPEKLTCREELGTMSVVITSNRDVLKQAENAREAEKSPYLRGGRAVDSVFKDIIEKLEKTQLILGRRINAWNDAVLVAEQRRRDAEAAETRRIANEAALKAERARKAEIKEAAEVKAAVTERQADEAEEAAQATPANMVRERFEGGPVVTMKVIKYAEITDISKIPLEVLRPYLKPSAIEVAVNAWARATEFNSTLPGVKVGERNESVVL